MTILDKHIKQFLNLYHSFSLVDSSKNYLSILRGVITVVDENNQVWSNYKVRIEIVSTYPYTIPNVYEESQLIERNWDYHISKNGYCCLNIPHNLLLKKRRGINLINFYQTEIYPFFANHQYRLADGNYAKGEYAHFEQGIIQYYEEELGLNNIEKIIQLLNFAINNKKIEPNKTCVICGNLKFKKCCRSVYNKLRLFGKEQLLKDLKIFKKHLESSKDLKS
ncbi:hypothetical protein [uncultured Aquimarina sp.]|uniref:hypothetical protein n=1 Tax=uncultured Aquimarina sp. TaxID=575652 RepID=UPI002606EF58|nr:hypothetical protein [uncultured Aquimarina sp.]